MDYSHVTLHSESFISPEASIIGDVTLGKNVSVFAGATLRGDCGAEIMVGDDSNIQENCVVHVRSAQPTMIGRGVTIGHGAIIHGCTLGDNSLIGMGAIVMDAAVVGNDCIVGAGALVTGGTQIPSGSLVVGCPARVKRSLTPQEIESNKKSAIDYVRIAREMTGKGLMVAGRSSDESKLTLCDKLTVATRFLKTKLGFIQPEVGLILGTGQNFLASSVENPLAIPYSDVPFMRNCTAQGHVGQFVFGTLGGKSVMIMQGRIHAYEGASAEEVAFGVWLMSKLGVRTLITTNAAGALNESYKPGDFCVMTDHINMTGRNPLANTETTTLGERFISMKDCYDTTLRAYALSVASKHDISLHKAVYLGLLGPSFETPAEIRLFQQFGADTVAMSVIEEVIAARQAGMRVLGISLVSNMACGINDASPSDDDIREVAQRHEKSFETLVTGVLNEMD